VLSTRFTPERGYTTESRRGGGGFISVIKLPLSPDAIYDDIFSRSLSDGISYNKGAQIIDRMRSGGQIPESGAAVLKAAISDKALIIPTARGKDALRLSILRAAYLEIKKGKGAV
jgi:transcriptional regulator CtsR